MVALNITLALAKKATWPQKSNSVEEAECLNVLQFLTAKERVRAMHELHRVLKPEGTCKLQIPHWSAGKYYGDLEVQWPPVTEAWFYRLNAAWRKATPHMGRYSCDFEFAIVYGMHPDIVPRPREFQETALKFWREAPQDLLVNLKKM